MQGQEGEVPIRLPERRAWHEDRTLRVPQVQGEVLGAFAGACRLPQVQAPALRAHKASQGRARARPGGPQKSQRQTRGPEAERQVIGSLLVCLWQLWCAGNGVLIPGSGGRGASLPIFVFFFPQQMCHTPTRLISMKSR